MEYFSKKPCSLKYVPCVTATSKWKNSSDKAGYNFYASIAKHSLI